MTVADLPGGARGPRVLSYASVSDLVSFSCLLYRDISFCFEAA